MTKRLELQALAADSANPAVAGDFGAYVQKMYEHHYLCFHGKTFEKLQETFPGQDESAAMLVAAIQAFPGVVAKAFGWEMDDVQRAYEKLQGQLKEYLPDSILNPGPPKQHAFGARDPKGLDAYKKDGSNLLDKEYRKD